MVFRFESFQLDVAERRLLRSGELIPLRAKVFDTLCILVENHGRLLRKDELMQRLWPDSVVEDNNLDHNISKLRRALTRRRQRPEVHRDRAAPGISLYCQGAANRPATSAVHTVVRSSGR